MAVKTYITKAYDRVDWSFLELTMSHMGFSAKFIGWIMETVRTVSYSGSH